jgi:enoyl-CoA hydratase/carnithine racemase
MEPSPQLEVLEDGPVVRVTLNRPDQLNALNDEVRRALSSLLSDLEDRPDLRVLVLRGAGRCFSGGADLRNTSYPPIEGDWATRRHRTGTWQRLLDQLGRIPQATVVGVHSHVVGGAVLLATACDIRIAADDTRLRIPELAMGIPLTWAGIPLLVREIGLPLARDWVMTCREVGVDELQRCGWAQRIAPAAELDAAVETCVAELAAIPAGPLAMARAMTSALGRADAGLAAGWGDADHQMWSFTEDEYREAVAAYGARLREARSR